MGSLVLALPCKQTGRTAGAASWGGHGLGVDVLSCRHKNVPGTRALQESLCVWFFFGTFWWSSDTWFHP